MQKKDEGEGRGGGMTEAIQQGGIQSSTSKVSSSSLIRHLSGSGTKGESNF